MTILAAASAAFVLLTANACASNSNTQPQELTSPNGTPRVLILDDEAISLGLAVRAVRKKSQDMNIELDIRSTLSAEEALRLHGEEAFDIVVTDRNMPEMQGEEFAQRIRKLSLDSLSTTSPRIILNSTDKVANDGNLFDAIVQKKPPEVAEQVMEMVRVGSRKNSLEDASK